MAIGGSVRSVALTVSANVSSYVASLGTAAAATTRFAATHAAAMSTAGTAVAGFGALAVAGLGVAANEAIKWESAWAGVTKTVDGSTSQMAALEGQLREMAKTLPASHAEIAAVAEAAGQLGIKREDVASFTKTMIDLGTSTNLTADQAATSLARFSNIMGTSASDVDRLGSALVALGNDGASTEGEIVTMALRIAGAGRSIGLTEGEVLGFANTLSSLGIEAEAGGTAISNVMLKIQQATDTGGDSLTQFARVAGVSAADFKARFEDDAAGAIQLFVDGLARADAQGQNTTGIMADLGFEGIRVTDTLRRLASDTDLLRDSLDLGNSAWAENRALVEEANKRYETTASRLQIARNNLRDTAITIGDQLLPIVQAGADGFADFARFVGEMDPALLGFLTNMTGVVGIVGLLAGGLLILVPQVAATVASMQQLAAAAPRAAGALSVLGKSAGIVVALYAVGSAIAAIRNNSVAAVPGVEATTDALLEMAEAGDAVALNELISGLSDSRYQFDDFAGAVDRLTNKNLGDKITDIGDGFFNIQGEAAQAEDAIANIDAALAQMVASGNGEQAAEVVAGLVEELGGGQEAVDKLMTLLPGYAEAQLAAARAQEEAAGSAENIALNVAGVAQTTEEAEADIQAFTSALDELFQQTFGVQEATDRFTEGLLGLTAAAEANGTSLTGNTAAAIANRDAFREITGEARNAIQAMIDNGATADEVSVATQGFKKQLLDAAAAAGYSADEVAIYSDYLDTIPGTYTATVSVAGADAAAAAVDRVISKLVSFDGRTATATVRTINSVTNRVSTETTRFEADGGVLEFYAAGGLRENHVAQIAPAGAMRVWAEPETLGEAYIPLAPSKRDRSVAITQAVADRFGYDLVPRRPVQYLADGGLTGTGRTAPAPLSLDGLAIEGTLELAGDGLTGYVKGVVRDAQSAQDRAIRSGRR